MKLLVLAALLCITPVISTAQGIVQEPEFDDAFAGLDAGKLIPLERQTSTIHAGGGGFMVVGTKAAYEFPGAKSPVRFHSGTQLDFVVRRAFAASSVDPNTFYVLRKLTTKKKSRELVFMTGKFSPLGGGMKTNLQQGVLPVTFSKYGLSSFKVAADGLVPGEYAFSLVSGQTVFCFGVD